MRLIRLLDILGWMLVSIHAPREGCDLGEMKIICPSRSFNSRTPGGVRLCSVERVKPETRFQFTHPGRGATIPGCCGHLHKQFQFTHPGRGATHSRLCRIHPPHVSIHAPREGCDTPTLSSSTSSSSFNSRTPGGVRLKIGNSLLHLSISFNSRTPGGVRHESYKDNRDD